MEPLPAPVYVDTGKALERLAERAARQRWIAVDTESNSLFAYRERLCLLQISLEDRDYLVDPLANLDLGRLAGVFADPAVVKVFHDAEYDVLTLKRAWPFEFSGLFDTKVAAGALGRTQLGLAALLREELGIELDKRLQRSNWGARPLSEAQLDYARRDTHYLIEIARRLRERLVAAGPPATLEFAAECRRLAALAPEVREFDPGGFARIKGADGLDPHGRRALRELFIMRHQLASERDVPAFKVLHNETLVALAAARPASEEALAEIRGMPAKLAQRYGARILETLRRAARMRPLQELPRARADAAAALPPAARGAYERLRAWRKRVAVKRPTDPALVLPRPLMVELARLSPPPRSVEELAESGLLETWRVAWFGEDIVRALLGDGGGEDAP